MRKEPPFKAPKPPPAGMLIYRLYFFGGDGHISSSHEFFAKEDNAAIKLAQAWREGRRMELWQRDRRVMVWD